MFGRAGFDPDEPDQPKPSRMSPTRAGPDERAAKPARMTARRTDGVFSLTDPLPRLGFHRMPGLEKKEMTMEEFALHAADHVHAKSKDEWIRKASMLTKTLRIVAADGETELDAALVVNALAPEEEPEGEEPVEEDSVDDGDAKGEDGDDPDRKSFVNYLVRALESHAKATERRVRSRDAVAKAFAASDVRVGKERLEDDPKGGFKHFGEFAHLARKAYSDTDSAEAKKDKRLRLKAPSTYSQESIGQDGGYLVPPEFSQQLLEHTFTAESLFDRTQQFTTGSNSLTIPLDETTPWGTSGVRAYWQQEAAQANQSKPELGQETMTLHRLTALVPVTGEMQEDSFIGLGQYLDAKASERIRWKVDEAILMGTGAGQPNGIFNSGAIVSVAKESGQSADTIQIENVAKVFSRIPDESITASLVWLIHPSAFPEIITMKIGDTPVYMPPGGATDSPAGRLMGVPVIKSQHCKVLGDKGDIFLLDLSKYVTLTKGTGIETAMSIHLFFDYNMNTFRFNFRVAGQPWMTEPIASQNGTFDMSPFVTLDERA